MLIVVHHMTLEYVLRVGLFYIFLWFIYFLIYFNRKIFVLTHARKLLLIFKITSSLPDKKVSKYLIFVFWQNYCRHSRSIVVQIFQWSIDHFIQPSIDSIFHVVPFRDLTPFGWMDTPNNITKNTEDTPIFFMGLFFLKFCIMWTLKSR